MPDRPRQNEKRPVERPALPVRRLFLLTIITAALAFALQALLALTDFPAAAAISLLVLPPAAGSIVFAGLRPYPAAGRLRLALMVAVGLFLLGLILS